MKITINPNPPLRLIPLNLILMNSANQLSHGRFQQRRRMDLRIIQRQPVLPHRIPRIHHEEGYRGNKSPPEEDHRFYAGVHYSRSGFDGICRIRNKPGVHYPRYRCLRIGSLWDISGIEQIRVISLI